ncbi:MAG: CoA pyrophosphatase [Burkholderiales bacterium]|nr:MAG: CoA pyrophosphatase [Burkholderiales bacterium]
MPLSLDTLREKIAHARTTQHYISGDGTSEERKLAHQVTGRTVRPAAVLILLTREHDISNDWNIVLTQRTAHLHDHAGQISFPGGRMDAEDADLVATALREASEEIGTNAQSIEVMGALPSYVTVTAYEVTPVVAVSGPQTYRCDPFEVADVFQVPLAHVLDEKNWRRDAFTRAGLRREYWAVPYRERYVWGATAGMLRTLKLVLSSGSR